MCSWCGRWLESEKILIIEEIVREILGVRDGDTRRFVEGHEIR